MEKWRVVLNIDIYNFSAYLILRRTKIVCAHHKIKKISGKIEKEFEIVWVGDEIKY